MAINFEETALLEHVFKEWELGGSGVARKFVHYVSPPVHENFSCREGPSAEKLAAATSEVKEKMENHGLLPSQANELYEQACDLIKETIVNMPAVEKNLKAACEAFRVSVEAIGLDSNKLDPYYVIALIWEQLLHRKAGAPSLSSVVAEYKGRLAALQDKTTNVEIYCRALLRFAYFRTLTDRALSGEVVTEVDRVMESVKRNRLESVWPPDMRYTTSLKLRLTVAELLQRVSSLGENDFKKRRELLLEGFKRLSTACLYHSCKNSGLMHRLLVFWFRLPCQHDESGELVRESFFVKLLREAFQSGSDFQADGLMELSLANPSDTSWDVRRTLFDECMRVLDECSSFGSDLRNLLRAVYIYRFYDFSNKSEERELLEAAVNHLQTVDFEKAKQSWQKKTHEREAGEWWNELISNSSFALLAWSAGTVKDSVFPPILRSWIEKWRAENGVRPLVGEGVQEETQHIGLTLPPITSEELALLDSE